MFFFSNLQLLTSSSLERHRGLRYTFFLVRLGGSKLTPASAVQSEYSEEEEEPCDSESESLRRRSLFSSLSSESDVDRASSRCWRRALLRVRRISKSSSTSGVGRGSSSSSSPSSDEETLIITRRLRSRPTSLRSRVPFELDVLRVTNCFRSINTIIKQPSI